MRTSQAYVLQSARRARALRVRYACAGGYVFVRVLLRDLCERLVRTLCVPCARLIHFHVWELPSWAHTVRTQCAHYASIARALCFFAYAA